MPDKRGEDRTFLNLGAIVPNMRTPMAPEVLAEPVGVLPPPPRRIRRRPLTKAHP
jgi:hypothetical protein